MSELLTLDQMSKVLPKGVKGALTESMVENINALMDDVQLAENYREKHLQSKYGISHQDYEDTKEAQNGKCAICGIEGKYCEYSRLAVGHDHDTDNVRGLLCKKCNQAIGLLQDTSSFALKAFEYLERHGK